MNFAEMIRSDIDDVFLNTDDFAEERQYIHGRDLLTIRVLPDTARERRRDNAGDVAFTSRSCDCATSVATLKVGDAPFLPTAGDQLRWTDEQLRKRTAIVFPLSAQKCYEFTDSSELMLRFFAIDERDLVCLQIKARGVNEFTVRALVGIPQTVGPQFDVPSGDVRVPEKRVALVIRDEFPDGVSKFDRSMEITEVVDGRPDKDRAWMLDLGGSKWGDELVTMGLERVPLVAMGELRRGETV